ncbi:pyridoxal phosphate-dependent transferase [Ilyonectria sp. MPI-CAGE-AT-0026]|nr:pyridoxal phosphate-dependent transferase [Ilyonectria sp. MPI-CAGE-AT-0026]
MNGTTRTRPQPARRVAQQPDDVWSIVNDAASKSPIQPVVNMGQGFFGYNPPEFLLDAAKDALNRVDANQYSPTKGRINLRRAIASHYSPSLEREINAESEVIITTGANEGILSAFMAFIEDGDEVIVFEPFFDQYISNIEMAGGTVKYVPLIPPARGDVETSTSGDWSIDVDKLERAFSSRTRMLVLNSPHNPVGKVFSTEELTLIGNLCVKHNIIIIADDVYDALTYVPSKRMATISPDVWNLTLTVGSSGKTFYATGWRIGFLIGPDDLIKYVAAAHMRICYSSPSPLQEACAVGYPLATKLGFWETCQKDMQSKIKLFVEVFEELGLPYSAPQGGYFVMANFSRVKIPHDYEFPPHVACRPRDFKLSWFLIVELGVAAIPPSEFYLPENAHVAENYLRFAVCKEDAVLEQAKEKLRGLSKYIA